MQCTSHVRMFLWHAGTPLPNYAICSPKNSTRHSHHHETLKPHITFNCLHVLYTCYLSAIYRVSQEEMSIFWEVTVSVILSKKVYMYMCPIPNVFRDRATSLYGYKTVHKQIWSIVSNIGIYCSRNEVGTVYLEQVIFENSTVNSSNGTTIAEAVNLQHISIFGICEDVWQFAQHSYNVTRWFVVTTNSYNSQPMLHTNSHFSYSGAVRREGRTLLVAKSKLLYSETALSRKLFGIGHVHIHFLLTMTDTVTSQNNDISSWDTLQKHTCKWGYASHTDEPIFIT